MHVCIYTMYYKIKLRTQSIQNDTIQCNVCYGVLWDVVQQCNGLADSRSRCKDRVYTRRTVPSRAFDHLSLLTIIPNTTTLNIAQGTVGKFLKSYLFINM